ncbi:MAG TPA: hypothetical protein VKE69_03905, partial [Planctomycetota bacterium]|nr:hypothetical protein [Planctomycetota bacterium]
MKREADRGYALLLAIAILAALFAIAAPFLLSARGSARSSGVRAGEARARIEAEAGFSTLVRKLEETDPEVDVTPGFDGEDEARPEIAPPQALYPTRDPGDAIVSGHAVDEQSRVDLGSASPYALGALMGAGFLTAQIAEGVDTLPVDATDGFPADGYLWVRGELIRYSAKTPTSFTGCERGVLGTDRGPYEEARAHPKGTPVLDARAHHAAKRRIRARENELAKYPTVASLVLAAAEPASAPTFTAADLDKLEPWLTIWADRNGHDDWSAAVRVIEPIVPDGKARTIAVEDGRWFGPGSTVRLQTNDGVELQLVVSTDGNRVTFEEPLRHGAGELEATAAVLVPNPIDVNSAPPELLERLLTGLDSEWAGAPDPLSRSSARELAKRIHEKPVTGFQDLVERILLPAADEGLLSGRQLHAVFANAENSNNRTLKHSTVPFTFGAGSVFRATVAASVNAPSGVERGRVEIEKVVEVRRQSHGSEAAGIRMVSRQSEWDERLRLSRRARGWMSYPYATTQFDGSDPPSRRYAWLHPTPAAIDAANANAGGPATMVQLTASQALGPIPPSNDPALSWAQLAPARSAYPDDRSEHFDLSATPEGQDLSKIAYSLDVADAKAGLGLAETGYFYAGSISGWFRTTSWGGTLFDTGAASLEHDRVTLSFEPGLTEGTDLVLRVRDGAGDDPDPAYLIPNEIRYPASQLTPDVWHHFSLNVHGSGPGDMALFVDGLPRGERKAFTRLTADLATWQPGDTVTPISVESTSGFPPFGVLRIGNELIDYSSATGKVFDPSWKTTGAGAYTGRRLARAAPEELLKPKSHTAGETVELYGYTARLSSWSYPGNGTLTSRLEKFSAARLDPNMSGLKEVAVGPSQLAQAGASFGNGILGGTSLPELQLDTLDPASEPYYLDAFPSTGGYVVVFQFIDVGTGWGKTTDQTQSSVFGCELMRYGSRQGKKLLNVQRGVVAAPHFPDGSQDGTGSKHAFVLKWGGFFTALAKDYRAWVYVVPCSIPMTGAPAENYL